MTSAGGTKINLPRPDVMQAFPRMAGRRAGTPAIETSFRASHLLERRHTVYVRVTDVTGCCYFLAPRAIKIDNAQQPAAVRRPRLPAARQRRQRERRPRRSPAGRSTTARRPRRRLRRRAPRAPGRDRHLPRPTLPRTIPDDPTAVSRGLHPERRLDAATERRPHGHRQGGRRPGAAGAPRHARGSRSSTTHRTSPPFGEVEFPLLNSTWFGNCFAVPGGIPSGGGGQIVDPRYLMFVDGWALDTSVAAGARRRLARPPRDGRRHHQGHPRRLPPRSSSLNNALVDCYGYYRPDIEVLYPGFPQAPNSGFHFVVDVGYLLTQSGLHGRGPHAPGEGRRQGGLLVPPEGGPDRHGVRDPEPRSAADRPIVDDPTNYELDRGRVPGPRLGARPRLRREGADPDRRRRADRRGDAAWTTPSTGSPAPTSRSSTRTIRRTDDARFRFYLDTTKISNSEHDLLVEVLDGRGNRRSAGTRRFLVDNNTLVR